MIGLTKALAKESSHFLESATKVHERDEDNDDIMIEAYIPPTI